jgi:hypothetical protein
LVVLALYDNGATNAASHFYNVNSFTYANLASTFKIATTIPAYINFVPPAFLAQSSSPLKFAWIYQTADSLNIYKQDDNNSTTRYAKQTITGFTSNYSIVASSDNCMIVS